MKCDHQQDRHGAQAIQLCQTGRACFSGWRAQLIILITDARSMAAEFPTTPNPLYQRFLAAKRPVKRQLTVSTRSPVVKTRPAKFCCIATRAQMVRSGAKLASRPRSLQRIYKSRGRISAATAPLFVLTSVALPHNFCGHGFRAVQGTAQKSRFAARLRYP